MSDYMAPALGIGFPVITGMAGGIITSKNMAWYATLKKPSWNPPKQVFGPVWGTLYGSMGYASYMVWRDGGGFDGDAALPLAWYGAQLALNWMWTPLFFGLHKPKWAFFETIAMVGAIAGTVYNFHGVNEKAAYLMLPYLGWVTFAGALTYKIWKLNPEKPAIEEKKE